VKTVTLLSGRRCGSYLHREPRNPNYLNAAYFTFLRQHNLGHVFLQGYYMPPIFDLYTAHADHLTGTVVIRLLACHGLFLAVPGVSHWRLPSPE
jgi:hypothetical protein